MPTQAPMPAKRCGAYAAITTTSVNASVAAISVRLAREKQPNIIHGTGVILLRAETGHAGSQAPFHLVIETGALKRTVHLQTARSQFEIFIYQSQRPTCVRRRKKRSEVQGAVLFDPARDKDAGEWFLDRKFQVRKTFVVLEMYVIAGLILLNEIGFQDKCFDFIIRYDIFQVVDFYHQVLGFRVKGAARLKIRPDTLAQGARLADIQDCPESVPEDIDAGIGGQ